MHFLVRVVDDFMFVSTEKEAACRFIEKAHSGLPSVGINVNMKKSRCSFDYQSESLSVPKLLSKDEQGKEFFSWCGLLFNTCTGAVHVDYERFSGGRAVGSIFMSHGGSDGLRLTLKMRGFVRPRALPLLYDLRVNTIHDIRINYCQAILLCAIKAHVYITRMDSGYRKNVLFLLSVIEDTLDYFYYTIRSRLKGKVADGEKGDVTNSPAALFTDRFTPLTAKWLGLFMFASTLAKQMSSDHYMLSIVTSRYRSLNIFDTDSLKLIAEEAMRSFFMICT